MKEQEREKVECSSVGVWNGRRSLLLQRENLAAITVFIPGPLLRGCY